MRFSRLAAVAGASVLVFGIASCSSTGGKPQETGGGMGAGQANTPRATVAMITHEVPGDSFWDLIRKGAQAAADKDNIELRYSNDPEAPNQANLVQSAIDSGVKGIALTLAKPDAMAPAVKAALDKNIPVVAFNSGFDNWKAMGVQEYFGQDEKLAGVAAGERLNKDGAKKVICVTSGAVLLQTFARGDPGELLVLAEVLLYAHCLPVVEARVEGDHDVLGACGLDCGCHGVRLAPAVKAASAKNIPVVAFNSGFDNWKAMGVQEYFGQDEKLAGIAAGERLQKDGAKKITQMIFLAPSFCRRSPAAMPASFSSWPKYSCTPIAFQLSKPELKATTGMFLSARP